MYQQKYREISFRATGSRNTGQGVVETRLVPGEISRLDEAYVRNVPLAWYVWLPVLVLAGIGQIPLFLIAAVRRSGVAFGGSRRGFKAFRGGPGIVVLPMAMRGRDGIELEIEVHGYVREDRLMVGDRIWAELRPQRRRDLPPRAVKVHNLATGQTVKPHPETIASHLGLPVFLQAAVGLVVLTLVIASWAL